MKTTTRAATAIAAAVLLAACAGSSAAADDPPNRDARADWVSLGDVPDSGLSNELWKRCDGTTLVYVLIGYNKGGPAVLADSPECAR